ncbi:hypothetical protein [Metabacillus endolithicus]|uniref:hypothetical protein n=1 Tax=Metabacillus endolithicus TaxID=1535204 RepID=UPI0031EF266C
MIKKLFSAMLAITLLFTPISGFLVGDHVTTVSAKYTNLVKNHLTQIQTTRHLLKRMILSKNPLQQKATPLQSQKPAV